MAQMRPQDQWSPAGEACKAEDHVGDETRHRLLAEEYAAARRI
jgi:hypothetical protein